QLSNLDQTQSDATFNSFTLSVSISNADFASVTTDTTQLAQFLTQPRKANGDLPDITLLHLVNGSDLVDKGVDIGFAFSGSAPDLGAFELGPVPGLLWKGDGVGNVWDVNTTSNWLSGTTSAVFTNSADVIFDNSGS